MDLSAFSGWLLLYRSPSTRAGYLYDLDVFTRWAMARGVQSPDNLTYQHCLAYLSERRGAGLSANACRRIVWAIRSWLEFELGPDHPAANLAPPRAPRRRQRCLSAEQLAAVLASCDTATPTGVRDLALIALMADSGLRSAEVCRLRLADLDLPGLRLSVQIKGGDDGAGVFSALTAQYLARWLEVRSGLAVCPAVFVHLYHGTQLTTSGLRVILRRIGRAAGLPGCRRSRRTTCAAPWPRSPRWRAHRLGSLRWAGAGHRWLWSRRTRQAWPLTLSAAIHPSSLRWDELTRNH